MITAAVLYVTIATDSGSVAPQTTSITASVTLQHRYPAATVVDLLEEPQSAAAASMGQLTITQLRHR